jgi:transposase
LTKSTTYLDFLVQAGPSWEVLPEGGRVGKIYGSMSGNATVPRDVSIRETVATELLPLVTLLERLAAEIKQCDAAIARLAKIDPVANALMSIPDIGPVTASAMVASVGDPFSF